MAKTMKKVVPSKLLKRGWCSRASVKKATQMSREQWQAYQVGMDAKWPLPDYMNGVKGHMAFKEETFAAVTCWTAATKISYRPHAKAPGSKSHLRYERYSKAQTVGQALRLGSYPADWCWDLERGFIKVVGGTIREEPLDTSKVPEGRLTDVDKAIHTWYKRELARRLGISLQELSEHQGWGESLAQHGARLVAQKDAKSILEKAERAGRAITDDEVLSTLQRWAFLRNTSRQNVMPKGQDWVFSDTLGLLRDRQGDVHRTAPTRRYPQVAELLAKWLTDRLPPQAKHFKFTSMNLNCNYAAKMHRDNANFGPSFISAFGKFSGGELVYWPEDPGGQLASVPRTKHVKLDISSDLALFNGNSAHAVQPFQGDRFSVVWFTAGCHSLAREEDKSKLRQLGFLYPDSDENPYSILRAPRGEGGVGQKKPAWLHWSRKKLGKGRVAKVLRKGKQRLAPEHGRSFYTAQQRAERRGWK